MTSQATCQPGSSPPITHRDLKLENVLETPRGVCKLCDFGSATARTFDPATATRKEKLDEEDTIQRYSTAMNRSPEMVDLHATPCRGPIGTPADVWALGCLLFTAAFQRHPFGDATLGIINGRFYYPPSSPYSPAINAIIDAALQTAPAARPAVAALIPRVTQAIADATAADLTQVPAGPAAAPRHQPMIDASGLGV